jgi:hypothetical protein
MTESTRKDPSLEWGQEIPHSLDWGHLKAMPPGRIGRPSQKFTITVEIGKMGSSHAAIYDSTNMSVYVSEEDLHKYEVSLASALAHEVGHCLARAIGLPNHQKMVNDFGLSYQNDKETRIAIENEAWDMAELIASRRKGMKAHMGDFGTETR